MRVDSKFKRVLAMIAIGFALVLIQYQITGRTSGVITGGILYFILAMAWRQVVKGVYLL